MGYGSISNGVQRPITAWEGSWAHQEQQRRAGVPWMPTDRERREEKERQDAARKVPPSQPKGWTP